MEFRNWLENYNREIIYLKRYLLSKPIDLVNNFYFFSDWDKAAGICRRAKVSLVKLRKMMDDERTNLEGDDFYDLCDKIEKVMSDEEKEGLAYRITQHQPADAPTWNYLSADKKSMLRPDTWLIHFSDDAFDIAYKGFKRGVDDVSKLGLTTYLSDYERKYPGYNFAFEADSRYAKEAARVEKYGKNAVMFQAAGVKAYHNGDNEDQVVFYGPTIDKSKLVLLIRNDDEWCVSTANYRSSRECMYKGKYMDVVYWVANNVHQYRRMITGH